MFGFQASHFHSMGGNDKPDSEKQNHIFAKAMRRYQKCNQSIQTIKVFIYSPNEKISHVCSCGIYDQLILSSHM